jgi:hypothetical protein
MGEGSLRGDDSDRPEVRTSTYPASRISRTRGDDNDVTTDDNYARRNDNYTAEKTIRAVVRMR